MRTCLLSVSSDGPLVPIEITLPLVNLQTLRAASAPLPAPIALQALVDIGADVSVFDPTVLAPLVALGLQPVKMHFVNAPALGGISTLVEYTIGLGVAPIANQPRSGLHLRSHPVVERPLGALGYQALLGRDVLDLCVLMYDGPGRRFTLAL